MAKEKNNKYVYVFMVLLFIIGVVSYVYSSMRKPEVPLRIMFYNIGGNVLFTHQNHNSDNGYGISCETCHHTWEKDRRNDPARCTECHPRQSEQELKRADAMHKQCKGCHEEGGSGPVKCAECHVYFF